jgi:dihydrofolate synthase/folylpolyglutamate synthase
VARLERSGAEAFRIVTDRSAYDDLRLPLPGLHQQENARVAVVALEALAGELGFDPEPVRVRNGLAAVRWPGRLQWIDGDPPLLLDGAHNPAGAGALAAHLRAEGHRKRILLMSAMRKKNVDQILRLVAPHAGAVVLTQPAVERAADPDDLLPLARSAFERVEVLEDPAEALERARALARPDGYVLVAGSLYLVGEILGLLEGAPVPGPVSM